MPKANFCAILLIIALCFISQTIGQTQPRSITAVKTANPPKIDGKLDDPCWVDAPEATDFVDQFFDTVVEDQTITLNLPNHSL